ncbi:circadian clock KaiB family protein [Methylotuvimicrobium alcaliphilum]|uniref:Thiol disulfide isomerase n=1 Tax=Methylotuvimicrobium alcaliphilum (strain DSM 19304 / NCIMB 14124 / VKM B-2133 / 20Z) TaxID=1091494 RepID=G4T094_META2|nr:circadian clock KaiB family protein [Methylotuvimicrobium alcaliphilum]CCE23384.1 putative thiol disulfide isomerase [Methylotuvimicrobium alcaliphilum 20Z]
MTQHQIFNFRLYVAGDALNSAQALANLTNLCRIHLPDRHRVEVVDVYLEPKRALADGIFMTPTLVKLTPSPTRKIVGSLNLMHPLLLSLGLAIPAS